MLHRAPMRRERYVELTCCLLLLFLLCAAATLFYLLTAPNWDVPLLCGAAALCLLLPLPPLLLQCFGERVLQVEFEGVVLSDRLFGRCLRRRVWAAEQMRAYKWWQETDGQLSLSLLIQDNPMARGRMVPALHTPSAYAFAAIWRDLELHYPGSAYGVEAPPTQDAAPPRGSRWVALVCVLAGLALPWLSRDVIVNPLVTCARGEVTPAVILSLDWDSAQKGSPYHLLVEAEGQQLRSSSAFSQSSAMPRPGQKLAALHTGSGVWYLPDEVTPFLVPLLLLGISFLLLLTGAWELSPASRRR